MQTIHQFSVTGIAGDTIDLAQFQGRKILIVNVASECGFTPQYQQLQELYEAFHDKFVIIGFPSNDFGGQEPGSEADILAFCQRRYGVTFPLTAKVHIKGDNPHPVYRWLQHQSENGVLSDTVKWNFHKYLLDEEGRLLAAFMSSVSPFDDRILSYFTS